MRCNPCDDHNLTVLTNRLKSSEIIHKVADYLCIPVEDILSKNRHKELVNARFIIAFILMSDRHLSMSLNSVAYALGKRDHSTIIHSLKIVKNQMMIYDDYRELIYDIFMHIYGSDIYFPPEYRKNHSFVISA